MAKVSKTTLTGFVENKRNGIAWHRINSAQSFDRPLFVDEALLNSGANYKVNKSKIAYLNDDVLAAIERYEKSLQNLKSGEIPKKEFIDVELLRNAIIEGKMATVRNDNALPLGVVSDSYGVVQNSDAFKFIDKIVTGLDDGRTDTPVIETAGVLGNGERIFVTAKFPNDIIINNNQNDRVNMYMIFTTSHDGTGAVQCMVAPIRVVCNNTLNYAMKHNSGKLSLRHTLNIMNRLDLTEKENAAFAFKALNMYDVYKNSLEEAFDRLNSVKVIESMLDDIVASISLSDTDYNIFKENGGNIEHDEIKTRGRNIFYGMKNAIESGVGQYTGERGTGMWLMNGITSYYQNEYPFKNEEYKLDSIITGHAHDKVQRAFERVYAEAL